MKGGQLSSWLDALNSQQQKERCEMLKERLLTHGAGVGLEVWSLFENVDGALSLIFL